MRKIFGTLVGGLGLVAAMALPAAAAPAHQPAAPAQQPAQKPAKPPAKPAKPHVGTTRRHVTKHRVKQVHPHRSGAARSPGQTRGAHK